jgi:hypothetical protein
VPAIGRTAPLSDAIAAIVELQMTGLPKGKLVIAPQVMSADHPERMGSVR